MQINIYRSYEYIPTDSYIINISKNKNNINGYSNKFINLLIHKNLIDNYVLNKFKTNLQNIINDIDVIYTEDITLALTIKLYLQYYFDTEDKNEYLDICKRFDINEILLKQLISDESFENELLNKIIKWKKIREVIYGK